MDREVRYMGRNGNRHACVVVRPRDVPDPWRSSRDGSRQEYEQICYTQPVLLVCAGRSRDHGSDQRGRDELLGRLGKAHH